MTWGIWNLKAEVERYRTWKLWKRLTDRLQFGMACAWVLSWARWNWKAEVERYRTWKLWKRLTDRLQFGTACAWVRATAMVPLPTRKVVPTGFEREHLPASPTKWSRRKPRLPVP